MSGPLYAALMAGPVAGIEQQGGVVFAILILLIAGTAAFVMIRNLFRGP